MVTVRRKIRTAVQDHVEWLRSGAGLDTVGEAHAQLALTLAGFIDGAEAADQLKLVAGWAKELRATLEALQPERGAGDVDPDAWLDDLDGSVTPIRHAKGS